MCAGVLRRIHLWLQRAVLDAPQLAEVVPTLRQAATLYGEGKYEECLSQVMAVGRKLEESRAAHPTLSPL
ncbi:hypothetical protein ABZ070_01620 [Streptomyces sp. NPDC006283]|uniref:hypothetical protein n=1 Tax=Streptomyces sp. NPDC006283 TaxID=3156741 RepID=UPI0033A4D028